MAHSSDWPEGMRIVNSEHARNIREQGMIKPTRTSGYIHLAAEIEHPHPLRKPGQRKQNIINQVKELTGQLISKGFNSPLLAAGLFIHFYSDGVNKNEPNAFDIVTGVWEYTAGWWTTKASLTNSDTPTAG